MRFGASFIVLCIGVIAASLGAIAYLTLGASLVESLATALTVASLLAAYHMFSGRAQERAEAMRQVTGLSRGTADLAHQVKELGMRVIAVEAETARAAEDARQLAQPLASEIEVLGQLVGQLAQSVAAHETALMFSPAAAVAAPAQASAYAPPPPAPAPAAPLAAPIAPAAKSRPAPPPPPVHAPVMPAAVAIDEMLDAPDDAALSPDLREAIEHNRLDLYLQPIVTLPQRKLRHYEALARLRLADGTVLAPADYGEEVARAGVSGMLDNLLVLRAVQIVRRLSSKNKEALLCVAISGSTLTDANFFPELFDFLLRHRTLAPALLLALPQETVREMSAAEQETLARLMELGYRFAMDRVTTLEIEPRRLAQQGFRVVKAPAGLLLDRQVAAQAVIAPADFSNLLARYGIDLVAEGVETEGTVIDLLDYDLRFAQGTLFAAPRPVRPEVLAPGADEAAEQQPTEAEAPAAHRAAAPLAAAPRRREQDDTGSPRSAAERNPHGLVKIARTIMRRA